MGAEEIRKNIRNHVRLAGKLAELVANDTRFEIVGKPVLGLVCFRLKGGCEYTNNLVDILSERKNIYVIRAHCHDKLVIRFVVNGLKPSEEDIEYAWNEIVMQTNEIYKKERYQLTVECNKSKCLTDFTTTVQLSTNLKPNHLFLIN